MRLPCTRLLARVRGRLTYANVIASLALFVALGRTSYAALRLPHNSVGPAQLSVRLRSVRPRCARGLSRLERSMTARSVGIRCARGDRNLAAALRRNARDATRLLPLLGVTSP